MKLRKMTIEQYVQNLIKSAQDAALERVRNEFYEQNKGIPFKAQAFENFKQTEIFKKQYDEILSDKLKKKHLDGDDPCSDSMIRKQYAQFVRNYENKKIKDREIQDRKQMRRKASNEIEHALSDYVREHQEFGTEILDREKVMACVGAYLKQEKIILPQINTKGYDIVLDASCKKQMELSPKNIQFFYEDPQIFYWPDIVAYEYPKVFGNSLFMDCLESEKAKDEEFKQLCDNLPWDLAGDLTYAQRPVMIIVMTRLEDICLCDELTHFFSDQNIWQMARQNKRYEGMMRSFEKKKKKEIAFEKMAETLVLNEIPDNFIDLYPLARSMNRHFVIHVGPTNSGKTYQSLLKFRQAQKAVYLAPLRLLAYEIYERTVKEGIPCDMVTGEEKIEEPGATHISSTIEMLRQEERYDVAVIDEAQMLEDRDRGYAWTAAILGVAAEQVHVCMAGYALDLVIHLIEECQDTYEVISHTRNTTLTEDKETFHFPQSVKPKDALIVFSKRSVLMAAAELQKEGFRTSIIYGALPYDVRQNEVGKFLRGETDVVVATDAIGMGMNLPIRRIVFLETEKFDGVRKRKLVSKEIKQIAGRAGRRGLYETGYYISEYDKGYIRRQMNVTEQQLEKASIMFPESLVALDLPLSTMLEKWNAIPDEGIYNKANTQTEYQLCKELEEYTKNRHLIYAFITIPFPERDNEIKNLWKDLFMLELERQTGDVDRSKGYLECALGQLEEDLSTEYHDDSKLLDLLEKNYQKCDLLYYYMNRFSNKEYISSVTAVRQDISEKLMEILARQKLSQKTCKNCGKPLPWNYPFRICEACFIDNKW